MKPRGYRRRWNLGHAALFLCLAAGVVFLPLMVIDAIAWFVGRPSLPVYWGVMIGIALLLGLAAFLLPTPPEYAPKPRHPRPCRKCGHARRGLRRRDRCPNCGAHPSRWRPLA